MRARILVVDDEPDLLELVRFNLDQAGFEVETAEAGLEGLETAARFRPDLVVLDLMLPDLSGLEVCRRLHKIAAGEGAPGAPAILMLTAKGEEVDRVVGFELGADDYVTKPFSPRELVLRVQAILRRARREPGAAGPATLLRRGALELDSERHRCSVDGRPLELTPKEFQLLFTLAARPGRVFPRRRLLDAVWGEDVAVTERTIDTHLRRLRQKLGAHGAALQTVRGIGYRFEAL